jgi:hypothetical protein
MNIYLDIDGVLLQKDGRLAKHFEEFLEFFFQSQCLLADDPLPRRGK